MAEAHRLLTKDAATRLATCSVCGPDTPMYRKGAYWRCGFVSKNRTTTWKKANPVRAQALRTASKRRCAGKPKAHELLTKDMLTLTGECAECGPVDIRRFGRGWICVNHLTYCRCSSLMTDDILWSYSPVDTPLQLDMCELCCKILALGFVAQGLMEPVLELTWPEFRISWDAAQWELESA